MAVKNLVPKLFCISFEQDKAIKNVAEQLNCSEAAVVRDILDKWLDWSGCITSDTSLIAGYATSEVSKKKAKRRNKI
jgi:hypothetical protein